MKYLQIISENPDGDLTIRPLVAIESRDGGEVIFRESVESSESTVYTKYGHTFSLEELVNAYTDFNMDYVEECVGIFGLDAINENGEISSGEMGFPIKLGSDEIEEIKYMLSTDDIDTLNDLHWCMNKRTFVKIFMTCLIFRRIKINSLMNWDWSDGTYMPPSDVHPVKGINPSIITADADEEIIIDEDDFYGFLKKCFGDKINDNGPLENKYNNG